MNNNDIEHLTRKCFPGCRTSILKKIDGGQSGALVFLVDISVNNDSEGTTTHFLNGQYILKVQDSPHGQKQESLRHTDATDRNRVFATAHIPKLLYSETIESYLFLLYEVAGQSQANFVAADTIDAAALQDYCACAAKDLWSQWNENYSVNVDTSASSSLKKWLTYRLKETEAPQLHSFVKKETNGASIFRMEDRVLVNPLYATCSTDIDVAVASVSFEGMIHRDLHLGNIIVDRTLRKVDKYWIIDFALTTNAPLGFDQAYLELSLLISLLQGVDPQRVLNILDALESEDASVSSTRIPVSDVGIFKSCSLIRQTNSAWQKSKEPNRIDSFVAQCLLSRIAVGLTWANKPLPEQKRRIALAYAAWAATRYFSLFNQPKYTNLLAEQSQPCQPLISPITPDWPQMWEQLGRFDDTQAKYVLITDQLDVSKELRSLALIPWAAIIDLDPSSNENGLYSEIGKTLALQRSVNQYGLNSIPLDGERSTSWFMAYGWPSRHEPVPVDFRHWRSSYGARYRQIFKELQNKAAPLPVRVIILASDNLDKQVLQSLIAMADESLQTASEITLIGNTHRVTDPAVKVHYSVAIPEFIKTIYHVFGAAIQVDEPTVPSKEAPAPLTLDQLRSLEEDIYVLHSKILEQTSTIDRETDSFWKGSPPSWPDLHANVDVQRELAPQLLKRVGDLLHARGNYTVELRHTPGSGGTTAALRCGWDLRRDFPVTVLRQYSRTTADRIDQIFRISQKSVLLIADAALLPPTSREELYREIAKRNVRCVILYVMRTFGEQLSEVSSPNRLKITDPMTDAESTAFLKAFSLRTNRPRRLHLLRHLATMDNWQPYRSPFFFGLTTYEEDFESVESYVQHHLSTMTTEKEKKALRFLALVTKYSQTGISSGLIKHFLGLDPASKIEIRAAFGDVIDRLIVRQAQSLRLLHPVIAQEVLRQTSGGNNWKYGLRDLCLEFISETADCLGPTAEETLQLFFVLFIRRDHWTQSSGYRRNFSEIIQDIPTSAGQHQVLLTLTETCPQEPHFWNHLGRHHIYELRQDYREAEQYLKKATELNPDEHAHHHSLGMVRRFWIRSIITEMLKHNPPHTAEDLFEAVHELFDSAAEEFKIARELSPEENYGYITHIQLILEILERLIQLDTGQDLPALLEKTNKIGIWARKSIVVAEDLLRQVQQLRANESPSRYELHCTTTLASLYGHFDAVISSLETLSKSVQDPDIRRALATAYFSRSGRIWAKLPDSELRATKDLMENNLRMNPTNERDIRSWFQAFRRLPEFSYIDAIDRLEGWAEEADQVDSYYYLYILHFLRWFEGSERDESSMRTNLEKCRQRALGKRGFSYEWFANTPTWCPLAHGSELGKWDEFWEKTESLQRVTGSIASIKPQTGTIRLGAHTVAHFVPGTKFVETRHMNSLIKCYIGFSYDGLRAWGVDFASNDSVNNAEKKNEPKKNLNNDAGRKSTIEQFSDSFSLDTTNKENLLGAVEQFIHDQLLQSISDSKTLCLGGLGNKLYKKFKSPPVYKRLGYDKLKTFLLSLPSLTLTEKGTTTVIAKSNDAE